MITAKLASRHDEDICLVLTFDNHKGTYVCDCGIATDLSVKECGDTKALFITHTHIDHFINFDTFLRHQLNSEFHTVICGPEGLAHSVWAKIQAYTWNLIQETTPGQMCYEVREIIDSSHYRKTLIYSPLWEKSESEIITSKTIYSTDKFTVDALALDHKIPSISYRFQEKNSVAIAIEKAPYPPGKWISELKNAFLDEDPTRLIAIDTDKVTAESLYSLLKVNNADSLGFIMDHAGTPENHAKISIHFRNVETLYIESFYADEDSEIARGNAHSTTTLSGKAAGLARAKKAIPLHFSRKYSHFKCQEMEKEFFDSYKSTLSSTVGLT